MDQLAIAKRYFDAWSNRDAEAIASMFDPDASFARSLFARFPDIVYELRGSPLACGDTVVARWSLRAPAARQPVHGVDLLTIDGDRIAAVERQYDSAALNALGGSLEVGSVVRVRSDNRSLPGAMGITWQEAPTEAGRRQVRGFSEQILKELPSTAGFIGGISAAIGERMLTVTAWEHANNPFELIRGRNQTHRAAAAWFFGPDVCSGGWTGVWQPARLNARYVRCTACRQLQNSSREGSKCACGATLPEPSAYW